MPKIEKHEHATFCWIELATNDVVASAGFYTELFGWTTSEMSMPGGAPGTYTMLLNGEAVVAGLFEMSPEMQAMKVPPHWSSTIAVDDVDAAAAKVEGLGGRVDAPPFDIPGIGRMAAVVDPAGARFNLFRDASEPSMVVNEPGHYCWSELYAKSVGSASEFYGGLLGWRTVQSKASDGGAYHTFEIGERTVAGMMEIRAEWGEVPSNWSTYFQVSDLEAVVAKAQELGGKMGMEPTTVPGMGRFVLLSDPWHAYFLVMEMSAD